MKRVEIFEGNIHDVGLLAQGHTSCPARREHEYQYTELLCWSSTAKIVIRALKKLKSECPRALKSLKIVLLSSATIDDHLAL